MYWSMMSMVPGIKKAICVCESPFTKTSNQRNLAKHVQVSVPFVFLLYLHCVVIYFPGIICIWMISSHYPKVNLSNQNRGVLNSRQETQTVTPSWSVLSLAILWVLPSFHVFFFWRAGAQLGSPWNLWRDVLWLFRCSLWQQKCVCVCVKRICWSFMALTFVFISFGTRISVFFWNMKWKLMLPTLCFFFWVSMFTYVHRTGARIFQGCQYFLPRGRV